MPSGESAVIGQEISQPILLPDHEILKLRRIVKLVNGKPSTGNLRLKELVEKG